MKKILVIFSILILSLSVNNSSLAQVDNAPVKKEIVSETVVNKKVETSKASETSDIQSLVMKDGYDWGKIIGKVLRALFLGIGAFLALIAFLILKNRKKVNQVVKDIKQESPNEPQVNNQLEEEITQNTAATNENSADQVKLAVYNFFKLNK